jgi:hypothetical protein
MDISTSFDSQFSLIKQHKIELCPNGNYIAYIVNNKDQSANEFIKYNQGLIERAQIWVTDIESKKVICRTPFSSWGPSFNKSGDKMAFFYADDSAILLGIWDFTTNTYSIFTDIKLRTHWYYVGSSPFWIDNNNVLAYLKPNDENYNSIPVKNENENTDGLTVKEYYFNREIQNKPDGKANYSNIPHSILGIININ